MLQFDQLSNFQARKSDVVISEGQCVSTLEVSRSHKPAWRVWPDWYLSWPRISAWLPAWLPPKLPGSPSNVQAFCLGGLGRGKYAEMKVSGFQIFTIKNFVLSCSSKNFFKVLLSKLHCSCNDSYSYICVNKGILNC